MPRCPWPKDDPLMIAYHDEEWGVVVRDGRALFGKLVLDGFQAGLSWRTILYKRPAFLEAFEGFDPERMARYGESDVARLLGNAGIIRSKAKISAALSNAHAYLRMEDEFSDFLWDFVGGRTVVHEYRQIGQIPAATHESTAMSKGLKTRGFKFCGPTICYAFMQAVGMVNDHLVDCPRHAGLSR